MKNNWSTYKAPVVFGVIILAVGLVSLFFYLEIKSIDKKKEDLNLEVHFLKKRIRGKS